MAADPHEELLSAYCDGELSPNEKSAVEQRLAADPVYRQLYDELVAQRTALRSLPRFRAPQELAALVSQRINQQAPAVRPAAAPTANAKTVEAAINHPTEARGADSQVTLPRDSGEFRRRVTIRAILWPCLAIAAALLVKFSTTGPAGAPRNVAQAPTKPIPSGDLVAGPDAHERSPLDQETADSPVDAIAKDGTSGRSTNSAARAEPVAPGDLRSTGETALAWQESLRSGELSIVEVSAAGGRQQQWLSTALVQQGVQFGKSRSIASDAGGEGDSQQAILVEATPERIAELVAAIGKESTEIALVEVRAGAQQRELLAAAGVPLRDADARPDTTALADASTGKRTLKPQAATVEKSAIEQAAPPDRDDNDLSKEASGQPLKMSAADILRLFNAADADQVAGNRQSNSQNEHPKDVDGGSPTGKIRVIFLPRSSIEGE
jgi:hypothetical protein